MTSKIERGKVPVSDGELYFESIGQGNPIIFIHAGFSDHRDWKYQFEDFGKKFKAIAYDQRGAGNSSVPTTPFWPANDLKALMDHLKISKAILVGHSIGGSVALDFAFQYPERVSALVLVAPGMNGFSWSQEYKAWEASLMNIPDVTEITRKVLLSPLYSTSLEKPALKQEFESITRENIQKVLTWKSFDIRLFVSDAVSKLKDLNTPTFVIHGDKDAPDILKIAQILNKNIPNIQIGQIKNSDHLLNLEKPKELNELILKFLSTYVGT